MEGGNTGDYSTVALARERSRDGRSGVAPEAACQHSPCGSTAKAARRGCFLCPHVAAAIRQHAALNGAQRVGINRVTDTCQKGRTWGAIHPAGTPRWGTPRGRGAQKEAQTVTEEAARGPEKDGKKSAEGTAWKPPGLGGINGALCAVASRKIGTRRWGRTATPSPADCVMCLACGLTQCRRWGPTVNNPCDRWAW